MRGVNDAGAIAICVVSKTSQSVVSGEDVRLTELEDRANRRHEVPCRLKLLLEMSSVTPRTYNRHFPRSTDVQQALSELLSVRSW